MTTYCLTTSRLPKRPAACFTPCSSGRSAGSGAGRRREDCCFKHVRYKQTLESFSFPVLYFILKPEVVTVFLRAMLSHQKCCVCLIAHWRWSSFERCSFRASASSKHNADTTPGNQTAEKFPRICTLWDLASDSAFIPLYKSMVVPDCWWLYIQVPEWKHATSAPKHSRFKPLKCKPLDEFSHPKVSEDINTDL